LKNLASVVVSSCLAGALSASAPAAFTLSFDQVNLAGNEFVFYSGMFQGNVTQVSITLTYVDGSPSAEADDAVWSFGTSIGTAYIGGADNFSKPGWTFIGEWDFFGNSTQSGTYTHVQPFSFTASVPQLITIGRGNGWPMGPLCGYGFEMTFFGNCTFTDVPEPAVLALLGSIPVFGGRRRRR
jgi:hypothetical protein